MEVQPWCKRYTRREKRLWGEKNRKGIENYKERVVMEGSCWSWKLVGGGIQGLKDDTVEVYCYQASLISLSLFEREFYFLFFTLTQCDYILFLLAKSTSFQAFYPLSTQTMCCRILMKTKLMFKCFYHILSCFIIAPTC